MTQTGHERKFILVIEKAHLLHKTVWHILKRFHEIGSLNDFYPGIVLLGDVDQIKNVVIKIKEILLRAVMFTETKFVNFDLKYIHASEDI